MTEKSFQMPGSGSAGTQGPGQPFADMSQGLAWMQTMWSTYMNSPMAPTLDLEELDRRIKDLKAVEQWLAINQNLLRSTIQGLEIQRTGIASLHAMMDQHRAAASAPAQAPRSQDSLSQTPPSMPEAADLNEAQKPQTEHPGLEQATQWWAFLQKQFEQLASHASLAASPTSDHVPGKGDRGRQANQEPGSSSKQAPSPDAERPPKQKPLIQFVLRFQHQAHRH
ncbi:MAG: hypothetical protein EBX63_03220 [Betaproteobacteria bacterium]|nr:hypothetical protein [Betaproteobacteria bacterium]